MSDSTSPPPAAIPPAVPVSTTTNSSPPHPPDPAPPSPDPNLPRLLQLAQQFSINTSKPHFPVNSLRLYYLALVDGLTHSHTPALDLTNQLIPKISALLNAHDRYLAQHPSPNPLEEINHLNPQINPLTQLLPHPTTSQAINHLFTYVFPLQESLILSLDQRLQQPQLSLIDFHQALHTRALDSIIYTSLLHQVINQHSAPTPTRPDSPSSTSPLTNPLAYQVHLASQLNDICDSVVYASQDLKSNSATLLQLLQKIHPGGQPVVHLIRQSLDKLTQQSQQFPLPQPAQAITQDFLTRLTTAITTTPTQPSH